MEINKNVLERCSSESPPPAVVISKHKRDLFIALCRLYPIIFVDRSQGSGMIRWVNTPIAYDCSY
eukprot:scaffold2510_cov169-Amphora_coffeaeformis.AAC.20